jgi:signal transduction histidine kinase
MSARPAWRDAAVAVATAAACALILSGRTGATVTAQSLVDWGSAVLAPVPLLWRSRTPVAAFWSVTALLVLSGLLGAQSPAALLVSLVALHAVARRRPGRFVWPAAAGAVLPGFLARLDEAATVTAFIAVTAVTVTTALIGLNQRTRHAYLSALEERADRLERDRDQRARLAVAGERARIAREMHDVVAHHLTVMVALSEGAAATVPSDAPRAAGVMTQVAATGRQSLTEMRRLVGLLRTDDEAPGPLPDDRFPQPGLADLDALAARIRAAGVRVVLTRAGTPAAWGPGPGLAVHRIVQESLTNTLKHAGPAATAEVHLEFEGNGVTIDVTDDGAGRPAARPDQAGRHGLTGMRERAAAYDGWLEAGPRAGPGWRVRARLRFTPERGFVA